MATIQQDLRAIRNAVYGKDVREAIADGIDIAYKKAVEAAESSGSGGGESGGNCKCDEIKEIIIAAFNDLKQAMSDAGQTTAVAILDQAILDLSQLG